MGCVANRFEADAAPIFRVEVIGVDRFIRYLGQAITNSSDEKKIIIIIIIITLITPTEYVSILTTVLHSNVFDCSTVARIREQPRVFSVQR